jgi:ribosomal protein S18 acetylase RimI-like enzyme
VTVTLRTAAADETDRLAQIFVAAWHAGYRDVVPAEVLAGIDEPTVTRWFASWQDSSELTTIVADTDGTATGFARYGTDPQEPDPTVGYLAALYVHPEAAGRGIGRTLLTAVIDRFVAGHCTAVTLWVFRDNAVARKLYSSVGFAADGAELTDPQWRTPQIRMRLSLD